MIDVSTNVAADINLMGSSAICRSSDAASDSLNRMPATAKRRQPSVRQPALVIAKDQIGQASVNDRQIGATLPDRRQVFEQHRFAMSAANTTQAFFERFFGGNCDAFACPLGKIAGKPLSFGILYTQGHGLTS
ncbi:MAG TPA: hypothetical protein VNF99_14935 [Stellaceae bacterium]|nr:hypothetical protein [Stellaceae bacterium]